MGDSLYNVNLSTEVNTKLNYLARRENVSKADVIRRLIREEFAKIIALKNDREIELLIEAAQDSRGAGGFEGDVHFRAMSLVGNYENFLGDLRDFLREVYGDDYLEKDARGEIDQLNSEKD